MDGIMFGEQVAPGSPAGIREIAARWAQQATGLRLAASQLVTQQVRAGAAWRDSPGAAAFARSVLGAWLPIDRTADVLEDAARTLLQFAAQLEQFQTRAAVLLGATEAAQRRLQADLGAVQQTAQPLAGIDPFNLDVAGQFRERAAAARDVQGALDAVASARRETSLLADDAQAAALLAAAALARGTETLSGWASGRSFGPYGGPPQASMLDSSAYLQYVDVYARNHPPVLPADPSTAAMYWRSLDPARQAAYLRLYPTVIGNARGVPADVRDRANRLTLTATLARARVQVSAAGRTLPGPDRDPNDPDAAAGIRESLRLAGYSEADGLAVAGALAVDYQLHRVATAALGHPGVQLLMFDPTDFSGKGRAAIAIGDIATARNVAVLVPGMTSDVPHYLPNLTSDALNVYDSTAADASTAVVAYVGYHAPGAEVNVGYQAYAAEGGARLAADLAGFAATRTVGPARTTVLAHSYGTTTAGWAFGRFGARADALVLVGSPGVGPVRNVAELNLPPDSVFVGSASSDPVTTIVQQAQDPAQVAVLGPRAAWHFAGPQAAGAAAVLLSATGVSTLAPLTGANLGVDPAGQKFGAVRFHAETGSQDRYQGANHSQYYAPGSESLANVSAVVTGRTDRVGKAPGRPEAGDHFEGFDPESGHRPDR